jgi:tetratricopeptide (TPR) repeat protein
MALEIKFRINALNKAILKLDPSNTEDLLKLRLHRGICYVDMEKAEESLIDGLFIAHHEYFPKLSADVQACVFALVSNAYFKISAFERSLKYAEMAIAKCPSDHFAIYMKGISLSELGRVSAAITSLKRGLLASPNFAPAYVGLAICYCLQGKVALSLLSIDKAIEITPDEPEYHETKAFLIESL